MLLVGICGFTQIVETRTFRGVTTQLLSDISGCPVRSCELVPRYFRFSSVRLASRDIELENTDSRTFSCSSPLGSTRPDPCCSISMHTGATNVPVTADAVVAVRS